MLHPSESGRPGVHASSVHCDITLPLGVSHFAPSVAVVQVAEYENNQMMLQSLQAPLHQEEDMAGARALDSLSPRFWRSYDSGRMLAQLDLQHVAFFAANGTDEAPQFANPWAYRNLPYVGYKPAYLMHHGHWEYMANLRQHAATPEMRYGPAVRLQSRPSATIVFAVVHRAPSGGNQRPLRGGRCWFSRCIPLQMCGLCVHAWPTPGSPRHAT